MTTTTDIIESASRAAGILAAGQNLEADIQSDALTRLNQMLARWRNRGVFIGINTPLAKDETIYIDDADEYCIESNLQVILRRRHKRNLDPGLIRDADEAFREVQSKYLSVPTMQLDSSLRCGGGVIDNELS